MFYFFTQATLFFQTTAGSALWDDIIPRLGFTDAVRALHADRSCAAGPRVPLASGVFHRDVGAASRARGLPVPAHLAPPYGVGG